MTPHLLRRRRFESLLCLLFGAWLVAIYVPGFGRGFIRDDFAWIRHSSLASWNDFLRAFTGSLGFYRPIVSLTFAADRALFDLAPLGHALTNALLLALCGAAIVLLARAFGLSPPAGILAAGLWMLNPHGINTTLLWMSGRTALLLTLFATLAAVAWKRGRAWLAGTLALLAMLSKEEAVLLPVVFFVWAALRTAPPGFSARRRLLSAFIETTPALLALALYLALRGRSDAMTPWTAPTYYQFSLAPALLLRNVGEYLHRSCTFQAAAVAVVAVAARVPARAFHVERETLWQLAAWAVGLFGLTVLLPARSGLYILAPSVAVALLAGHWIARMLENADSRARRRVLVATLAVATISVPIYWTRNAPDAKRAALTSMVLREIAPVLRTLPPQAGLVIRDRRDGQANLEDAFAGLETEAGLLFSGRTDVWVRAEAAPAAVRTVNGPSPDAARPAAVFELSAGRLYRVP